MNASQTITDTTTEAPMTQDAGVALRTPGSGDRYVAAGTGASIDAVIWKHGTDHPPDVTLRTCEGHAADVLVEESRTARLLVIASRGRGEFAGPPFMICGASR